MAAPRRAGRVSRRSAAPWVLGILAALVLAAALLSVSLGAIRIPPERVRYHLCWGSQNHPQSNGV